MKKIILIGTFIIIASVSARAALFLDLNGTFLTAGDAEYQYGGGGGLGIDFLPRFSFLYRGMYTFASFDVNTNKEKEFGYMLQMIGVEYVYPIPKAYMGWKSSVMVGISQLSISDKVVRRDLYGYIITDSLGYPSYRSRQREETGVTVGIWTGVKFDVSQHVSPFIDIGYHYSFFSGELKNELIHGVHLMFGVRFILWGGNKNLYDDY